MKHFQILKQKNDSKLENVSNLVCFCTKMHLFVCTIEPNSKKNAFDDVESKNDEKKCVSANVGSMNNEKKVLPPTWEASTTKKMYFRQCGKHPTTNVKRFRQCGRHQRRT